MILHLFLEPVPQLLTDLWVIRLFPAAAKARPWDQELSEGCEETVRLESTWSTHVAIVIYDVGHGSRPQLGQRAVRRGIEDHVLFHGQSRARDNS